MKKYELTAESIVMLGRTLFRIKALVAFGDVKEGEFGGFVEKDENLDQSGDAWVFGDAQVFGGARVSGDAMVFGDARPCFSFGIASRDDTPVQQDKQNHSQ